MTLIAHSLNDNVPFIVGDILLSSQGIKQEFIPPTLSLDISPFMDESPEKFFPAALARKVYIITPKLVLAMAGVEYEMKEFLKELRLKAGYYPVLTVEHVKRILNDYPLDTHYRRSSFLMILVEDRPDGTIEIGTFTCGNWNAAETKLYDTMHARGSGSDGFLWRGNEKVEFTSNAEKQDIRYAVQTNTTLIARLLAIERARLWNLDDGWGCGFELVFYDYDHFMRFDQIAYVIFHAQYDDQGHIGDPYPAKIMYYKYYDETLVITSIDMQQATLDYANGYYTGVASQCSTQVFEVPPLADAPQEPFEEMVTDISFSTYRIAAGFIITTKDNEVFTPAFFSEGPDMHIEYIPHEKLSLTIHERLFEQIRMAAAKAFPMMNMQTND